MIKLDAFGKNDIRGIYGDTVTEDLFYYVGKAYVKYVQYRTKKEKVVISLIRDVRLSSLPLMKSLLKGILDAGGNAVNLGMGPTPLAYFSEFSEVTVSMNVDASLIVTASHNPPEYNGLKMTCQQKSLNEEQIQEVKNLTQQVIDGKVVFNGLTGSYTKIDITEDYINTLLAMYGDDKKNVKIVTDCANASAGVIAPKLLKALGYDVVELYTEPDGTFPNHHPNPSIESTLEELKKTVVATGADVGVAFDGDADRIGVIDADGNYLTGDKLLYFYAATDIAPLHKGAADKPTVVSEVKCSQVLFDSLEKLGINAVMCKTGHGFIKAKMAETGAVAAGEMSGHMFFADRWFGFDDAVFAAARLGYIIYTLKQKNPDFKMSDVLKPFASVYTSPEIRFPCADELKKPILQKLEKMIIANPDLFRDTIKEIIKLDGLRIVFNGGFAMIRQSNTEPVFTLRFEGKTKDKCDGYRDALINQLEKLCSEMKG